MWLQPQGRAKQILRRNRIQTRQQRRRVPRVVRRQREPPIRRRRLMQRQPPRVRLPMHPKRTARRGKTELKMESMGTARKNRQARRKRARENSSPGEVLQQGEDQEKRHGVPPNGAAPRVLFSSIGRLAEAKTIVFISDTLLPC